MHQCEQAHASVGYASRCRLNPSISPVCATAAAAVVLRVHFDGKLSHECLVASVCALLRFPSLSLPGALRCNEERGKIPYGDSPNAVSVAVGNPASYEPFAIARTRGSTIIDRIHAASGAALHHQRSHDQRRRRGIPRDRMKRRTWLSIWTDLTIA